jgi:hypothetical protein
VDTNFFISGRMYRIAHSSLHGLGLFSMDGIKVSYGTVTELWSITDHYTNTIIG